MEKNWYCAECGEPLSKEDKMNNSKKERKKSQIENSTNDVYEKLREYKRIIRWWNNKEEYDVIKNSIG